MPRADPPPGILLGIAAQRIDHVRPMRIAKSPYLLDNALFDLGHVDACKPASLGIAGRPALAHEHVNEAGWVVEYVRGSWVVGSVPA